MLVLQGWQLDCLDVQTGIHQLPNSDHTNQSAVSQKDTAQRSLVATLGWSFSNAALL